MKDKDTQLLEEAYKKIKENLDFMPDENKVDNWFTKNESNIPYDLASTTEQHQRLRNILMKAFSDGYAEAEAAHWTAYGEEL